MGSIRLAVDRRAVTPVVGIVLVVALTILLAATVAAFAFTLGDEPPPSQEAPTTAFDFEFEGDASGQDVLRIVHLRGDAVSPSRFVVDVDDARCAGGSGDPDRRLNLEDDWGLTADLTSGQTVQLTQPLPAAGVTDLCPSGDLDLREATVRLVWESDEGTSRQLRVWEGPGTG